MEEPIVTFHRAYPAALWPMQADNSALGNMPAAAFQYCEAMRAASEFGWYVFPPVDIRLRWTGGESLYWADGEWHSFTSVDLDDEFLHYWDQHAPPDLKGQAPPCLTSLFVPGSVQIWSGLLVSTAEGWSTLIRPIVNVPQVGAFQCYEGLVETDGFKPCPLFVNIRLIVTDREIVIRRDWPLFQVQPINRACYARTTLKHREFDGIEPRLGGVTGISEADWAGFRKTTRSGDPGSDDHVSGTYGGGVRRRAKQDNR
jgi:hypothetical protein